MATPVDTSDLEGGVRYVDAVNASTGKSLRASDSDASGTRTDVEHALHSTWIDPGSEAPLDELGDGRTRNEHARIHLECESGEPGFAGKVDGWHSFFDTPRDEIAHAPLGIRPDPLGVDRCARVMRKPQRMEHERGRFVEGVIGPMTEENLGAAQPARATLDERTD